ncbi:MAG: PEP-CTERM sorting domain-containing protein, partial [Thermoguttaceae bacterium]|nr:PEP-CTERM sorting domain-containing protein [Thermoguttaceae bacterium]
KEVVINTTGKMNVNSPLDFTANKTLTLNGSLDIGAGGKFTASSTNGQVFRAGQGTATPTLNIHDGGVLEIGGNTRFLMGDAATSIVTIDVDGEGSLLKYAATQDCALGYHGTGKTTVSNGGEISTVNLQVGVNNNNVEGVVPSELTIVGAGSAVNATGTVSIGYTNQKGILNMNATNDGFGKITAGTFTRYTQKESEINLGIDHGVLMTENYPAAGYEIVKATTVNNWAVNNASVWETTVSGGTVTATLAENKKAGDLENGTIDVTGDLKIAGWVDYTIPEGWNITMSFSGVTGDDEMENLANWINEGSGEMNFTPVGNTLNLFDVPAMSGILAWDFAGFNALYGANVALESASAYIPEPSTFVLLILGVFALLRGRRFQRR